MKAWWWDKPQSFVKLWDMTINKPNHKDTNPSTQFTHWNWRMAQQKNGNGFFKQLLCVWCRIVVHCLEVTPLLLQRKWHPSPVPRLRWQPSDCPLPLCYVVSAAVSSCSSIWITMGRRLTPQTRGTDGTHSGQLKKKHSAFMDMQSNSQCDEWLNSAAKKSCLQGTFTVCVNYFHTSPRRLYTRGMNRK